MFRGNLFENEVLEKPLPLGPSLINLGERRRYSEVRLVSGRSPSTLKTGLEVRVQPGKGFVFSVSLALNCLRDFSEDFSFFLNHRIVSVHNKLRRKTELFILWSFMSLTKVVN